MDTPVSPISSGAASTEKVTVAFAFSLLVAAAIPYGNIGKLR